MATNRSARKVVNERSEAFLSAIGGRAFRSIDITAVIVFAHCSPRSSVRIAVTTVPWHCLLSAAAPAFQRCPPACERSSQPLHPSLSSSLTSAPHELRTRANLLLFGHPAAGARIRAHQGQRAESKVEQTRAALGKRGSMVTRASNRRRPVCGRLLIVPLLCSPSLSCLCRAAAGGVPWRRVRG